MARLKTDPVFGITTPPGCDGLFHETNGHNVANDPVKFLTILADMIPERTLAAGGAGGSGVEGTVLSLQEKFADASAGEIKVFEMKANMNGWPQERTDMRWLHSDIREVAYTFTWPAWQKIVDTAGLDRDRKIDKTMKKYLMRILVSLLGSSLTCCGETETEIKFMISVVDEKDEPVANVECIASMYRGKAEGGPGLAPYNVRAITNLDGNTILQGETVYFNNTVVARKTGYYENRIDRMWITGRNGRRWEPWPVEVKFTMKRIHNPKPMYAAKFDGQRWLNFPDRQHGPFGFDLIVGDWVAPHGQGEIADFIMTGIVDDANHESFNPKGRMLLTFSNPLDGILKKYDAGGSVLVGPVSAPETGYERRWEFENMREDENTSIGYTWDFRNEVYVFRVRTKTDDSGSITASYYGKLDGRIIARMSPTAPRILMTYYLNGTPNDRGLEWNMKTNLIEDTSRMRVPDRP
jgi:hypothetical protein